MFKNKKIIYPITIIPIFIILALFIWIFMIIFEGEKPMINIDPKYEYLTGNQKFNIKISDKRRGLKRITVSCIQDGRQAIVFEKQFPFKGIMNREGNLAFETEVEISPERLHLAQDPVDINIQVWDYSRRHGGDGNMGILSHKMTVDTMPPAIAALSPINNVNKGGTGFVVYRTSPDTCESGIYVDDSFFPGFSASKDIDEGLYLVYFTVPHNAKAKPVIYLWAKDRAENISKAQFYCHVKNKRFRTDKINISDSFLGKILSYFSDYLSDHNGDDISKFLKINNDLRKIDDSRFYELGKNSIPERLWEGNWLRLENAATMARFADLRVYFYKDNKIDEKYHLGVDLASLANSPITASNHGKVIFAEKNGIYGLTIVIDHGQGLMSLYGHLSSFEVKKDQFVKKGDIIGRTGQTGLAGGDHLHFSIIVNGDFVNPIEWWDSHWIEDNITKKLELIEKDKKK